MKLLYHSIVRMFRVFCHLYFVEIRSSGKKRVPAKGPVILAANHPSSILDSILLATQIPRPINYIARSGLFRYPILATLFRRLGAIPIYRANETEDSSARNVPVFEKVYQMFERGGCIGIFPEGKNSPKGQVGQLRPGAARIALEAEARNDFKLGLIIVPVGVNFEHQELLMSSVLLRFATPITVSDYGDLYRRNPEAAVDQLTADVQNALRRQALHIEDSQVGELIDDLSAVYGSELAARLDVNAPPVEQDLTDRPWYKRGMWRLLGWYHRSSAKGGEDFESRIQSRQQVSETLARASRERPREVLALRRQVDRYKDHLAQAELALTHPLDEPVRDRLIRLRMTIYALVMAPIALFGLVHNAVPYVLAKYLPRISRDEAVRAFAYFGVGFLAFTITYTGLGIWLWRSTAMTWPWVLFYLALLPPSGFATLRYRRNILIYRNRILVRTFFWNQEELVQLLRQERQGIFDRFQSLINHHERRKAA